MADTVTQVRNKTVELLYPRFQEWLKSQGMGSVHGLHRIQKWCEFMDTTRQVDNESNCNG
jgi:hypothetical protein